MKKRAASVRAARPLTLAAPCFNPISLFLVPQRERSRGSYHFFLAAGGEAQGGALAGLHADLLRLLDLLALLGPAGADVILVDLIGLQRGRDEPPARTGLLGLLVLDPDLGIRGDFDDNVG